MATEQCILSALEQSGFDPSDHIIWCYEFKENDYLQVFGLSLILFLMSFGIYLFETSKYVQPKSRPLLFSLASRQQSERVHDQLRDMVLVRPSDRIGGMPVTLYFILQALLSVIYLSIKVVLIADATVNNRYMSINQRYQDGFSSFLSGETLVLLFVLVSRFPPTRTMFVASTHLHSRCMLICSLCIWIDALCSLVLLCYKWSLLIVLLYLIAVGIVCACGVLCLSPSFMAMGVSLMTNLAKTFNRIERRCGGQLVIWTCIVFLVSLFGLLVLSCCWALAFSFIGGPPYSVVYLNGSDMYHMAVLILFAMSAGIGLLSVLITTCYNCMDDGDSDTEPLYSAQLQYV